MIGLIIVILVVLLIMGLAIWAVDHLASLGLPPPVLIIAKVIIIVVGILIIVQRAGLIPGVW